MFRLFNFTNKKVSASHNLIRCGNGVSGRPDIPKNIYAQHLEWHNQEPSKEYPFSGSYSAYINSVIDTVSIREFTSSMNNTNDSSDEFIFIRTIFETMKKVYTTRVTMKMSEAIYNYYMVHPLLELVTESICGKTPCGFFPGETVLCAMKKVKKRR